LSSLDEYFVDGALLEKFNPIQWVSSVWINMVLFCFLQEPLSPVGTVNFIQLSGKVNIFLRKMISRFLQILKTGFCC